MALDPEEKATVKRAESGEKPIGIVSTAPGLLLGQDVLDGKPIALKGRVPLKVNLEGGSIAVGDSITLSSEAGVGTKATTTSYQIAIALEESVGDDEQVIEVFVQNGTYFAPDMLAGLGALGEVATTSDLVAAAAEESFMGNVLKNFFAYVVAQLGDAGNGIAGIFTQTLTAKVVHADVGNIKNINTDKLCVGAVCVTEERFLEIVGSSGGDAPEPEPTPEPAPEPEPEPTPEPTPSPEPPPEPAPGPTPAPEPESAPEPAPEPEPEPAPAPEPAPEPTTP